MKKNLKIIVELRIEERKKDLNLINVNERP